MEHNQDEVLIKFHTGFIQHANALWEQDYINLAMYTEMVKLIAI